MATTQYRKGQYLSVTYTSFTIDSEGHHQPIDCIEYGTIIMMDEETQQITLADELDEKGHVTGQTHLFTFRANQPQVTLIQVIPQEN